MDITCNRIIIKKKCVRISLRTFSIMKHLIDGRKEQDVWMLRLMREQTSFFSVETEMICIRYIYNSLFLAFLRIEMEEELWVTFDGFSFFILEKNKCIENNYRPLETFYFVFLDRQWNRTMAIREKNHFSLLHPGGDRFRSVQAKGYHYFMNLIFWLYFFFLSFGLLWVITRIGWIRVQRNSFRNK